MAESRQAQHRPGGSASPAPRASRRRTAPAALGAGLLVALTQSMSMLGAAPILLPCRDPAHSEPGGRSELLSRDAIVPGDRDGAINAAWRDQRQRLLAMYEHAPAGLLDAHAARIESALVALDRDAPASLIPDPDAAAWAAPGGELALEFVRRRDRIITQTFARFDRAPIEPDAPDVHAALASTSESLITLRAGFSSFASLSGRLEAALDNGQPPGRALAAWASHPLSRDPSLDNAIAKLRRRVEDLTRVEQETDPVRLVGLIELPSGDPAAAPPATELVLAAWRRLGNIPGQAWPVTADELAAEARIIRRLRSVADGWPAGRAASLRQEIASESARRVKRLLAAADRDDQFHAAADFLPLTGLEPDSLDPPVRFNLLLAEFRRSIASSAAQVPDEAAIEAARSFLERARGLPGGIAFRADASATIDRIDRIVAADNRSEQPRPPDPARLGPGSRAGRFTAVSDGRRITFKPAGGEERGAPSLVFLRIEGDPSASLAPFYLSVHEVSVGAFIEIARGTDPPLHGLLPASDPRADPRLGPRTWEWDARRRTIQPPQQWLAGSTPNQYGPPGPPPGPALDHPLQRIQPEAAAAAAALVGCRLPTPAEWRRADQLIGEARQGEGLNLRDQTWARYDDHVRRAIARGFNIQSSLAGCFDPTSSNASVNDDRTLWFARVNVGGGEPLHHFHGNVAEWLADPEGPGAPAFFIAGGSSLSDPDPRSRQPSPIAPEDAVEGFADVGFRLAFSAEPTPTPGQTLAQRLAAALSPTPYLRAR